MVVNSNVSDMINPLNWVLLSERKPPKRLVMMYKITHLVARPSETILIPAE